MVEILKLMLGRDSDDEIWSRFVFELVIWTQPSGPLCLWQCLISNLFWPYFVQLLRATLLSLRWVRWSQGGYTVRCGTMRATWPWSCSLWQTPFSSWAFFIRSDCQHLSFLWFCHYLYSCKSLLSIGSSPPKPWLCVSIVGFCNGGISFLTGSKFFYIKVLNFNLWSKCRKLNWNNFSTPMENRCWNRRYLILCFSFLSKNPIYSAPSPIVLAFLHRRSSLSCGDESFKHMVGKYILLQRKQHKMTSKCMTWNKWKPKDKYKQNWK